MRKRSNMNTTAPGYKNRNRQVVIRKTEQKGTDHNQYVHVLECRNPEQPKCRHRYGANGSDIFQRKCPECQGGENGLTI